MKTIQIDLKNISALDNMTFYAGVQGEHNATELDFEIPQLAEPQKRLIHSIVFSNGFISDPLLDVNNAIKYLLPSDATAERKITATLESYDSNIRVFKSPLITLLFDTAINVPEIKPDAQGIFRREFATLSAETKAAADAARQAAADIGDSVDKAQQASKDAAQAVTDAQTAVSNAKTAVHSAATATEKANAAAQAAQTATQQIPKTVDAALEEAKALGVFDGEDGVSPTVNFTSIENGTRVTVTDLTGSHSADILNGAKGDKGEAGKNGVSPTASTQAIEGGNRVTFTDSTGSKSFDVLNGKDGIDSDLPKPTPEDNGKFLRVSNGKYALESVPTAEGAEF